MAASVSEPGSIQSGSDSPPIARRLMALRAEDETRPVNDASISGREGEDGLVSSRVEK